MADILGLPYAYPDPSPIQFDPDSLWTASPHQPRNELLNRLFVASVEDGKGLAFLDKLIRHLWDGSNPGWDQGEFLNQSMASIGLQMDAQLASMSWGRAKSILSANEDAMLQAGHWGVPLMVLDGEPFYVQDRFDHLVWRLRKNYFCE